MCVVDVAKSEIIIRPKAYTGSVDFSSIADSEAFQLYYYSDKNTMYKIVKYKVENNELIILEWNLVPISPEITDAVTSAIKKDNPEVKESNVSHDVSFQTVAPISEMNDAFQKQELYTSTVFNEIISEIDEPFSPFLLSMKLDDLGWNVSYPIKLLSSREEYLTFLKDVSTQAHLLCTRAEFSGFQFIAGYAEAKITYVQSLTNTFHNVCSSVLEIEACDYGGFCLKLSSLGRYAKEFRLIPNWVYREISSVIDFKYDKKLSIAAMKQLTGKYLVQSRAEKKIFEVPQFLTMSVFVLSFFKHFEKLAELNDEEIKWTAFIRFCKNAYLESERNHSITLATPSMAGCRTPEYQMSSCVKLDCGDSRGSIESTALAILRYIPLKAGLGINIGRLRHRKAQIGVIGEKISSGGAQFAQAFANLTTCISQGGIRKGSATAFYPMWTRDFMTYIEFRMSGNLEADRIREINFAIQMDAYLIKKLLTEEFFTLLPVDERNCPDLYESFFLPDRSKFIELYEKYSSHPLAIKVESSLMIAKITNEVTGSSGTYFQFVDNSNEFTPFLTGEKLKIYLSNLCVAGDSLIHTDSGLHKAVDLYNSQEEFQATIDLRTEQSMQALGCELRPTIGMKLTKSQAQLFKITLMNGLELRSTDWHQFYVQRDSCEANPLKIPLNEINIETDKLLLQSGEGFFGKGGSFNEGYLVGHILGCGTVRKGHACCVFWDEPTLDWFETVVLENKQYTKSSFTYRNRDTNEYSGKDISETFFSYLSSKDADCTKLLSKSREFQLGVVQGLFDADATSYKTNHGQTKFTYGVQIRQKRGKLLQVIQILLQNFGIMSNLSDEKEDQGFYRSLDVASKSLLRLMEKLSEVNPNSSMFMNPIKQEKLLDRIQRLNDVVDDVPHSLMQIKHIKPDRVESVYDTTQTVSNSLIFNGIVTGNCMEISLPTEVLDNRGDEGEIALCTLAAQNCGNVGRIVEWIKAKRYDLIRDSMRNAFELPAKMIVTYLDSCLSFQTYPLEAAKRHTDKYRPLGVGLNNLAYLFALNDVTYDSEEAKIITHMVAESHQYFLLKASSELAEELGAPEGFYNTKYSLGNLPIDWYKRTVDEIFDSVENSNDLLLWEWDTLRGKPLRNCTLSAHMPGETSSQKINATTMMHPPKDIVTIKDSPDSVHRQIVPMASKLKYQTRWNTSNEDYLKILAIANKFSDQSISTEIAFKSETDDLDDPMLASASNLFNAVILAHYYGLKTIYYTIIEDGNMNTVSAETCDFCVS
jgi:ribonucleotide reductase alpha subunit